MNKKITHKCTHIHNILSPSPLPLAPSILLSLSHSSLSLYLSLPHSLSLSPLFLTDIHTYIRTQKTSVSQNVRTYTETNSLPHMRTHTRTHTHACQHSQMHKQANILLNRFVLPIHTLFPLHPFIHWQVNDPTVLLQIARAWQVWAPLVHSSISDGELQNRTQWCISTLMANPFPQHTCSATHVHGCVHLTATITCRLHELQ